MTALHFLASALLLVSLGRAAEPSVLEAARSADTPALHRALQKNDAAVNAQDDRGFTPLIYATWRLSTREMEALLSRGAEVNHRATSNVTAFNFAVANLSKARLLIKSGFTLEGAAGREALLLAARHPQGFEVAKLLVKHGVSVRANANDKTVNGPRLLIEAINSGDFQKLKWLVENGAEVHSAGSPDAERRNLLLSAIYRHNLPAARYLLNQGVDLNVSDQNGGHSLSAALLNDFHEIVPELLKRGADVHAAVNIGEIPPIVMAAHNERGSAAAVKLLLEHGANLNARNERDETALTWARKRGETELVRFLESKGAEDPAKPRRPAIPANAVLLTEENRAPVIREAVTRSLALLEKASNGFMNREGRPNACISCHHQMLPAVAFAWGEELQLGSRAATMKRQTEVQMKAWRANAHRAWRFNEPQPGAVDTAAYGIVHLAANKHTPDAVTEAITFYLANVQWQDGRWETFRARPPSEAHPITATALAIRALQLYPPVEPKHAAKQRSGAAAKYLLRQDAYTMEERTFQIMGLLWADGNHVAVKRLARELLRHQRADGGWSQLPTMESDAYATGQALVTLTLSGALSVDDAAYRRGAEFLLRTQFPDGSWFVKSRSWPFQTHFATGFPFGRDQWIAASATTWAALALMTALDPAGPPVLRRN